MLDRPRNTEAGAFDRQLMCGDEPGHDLVEATVLAARIRLPHDQPEAPSHYLEEGEPRRSAANVTRENHSILLHCRPSHSSSSSASFGPPRACRVVGARLRRCQQY